MKTMTRRKLMLRASVRDAALAQEALPSMTQSLIDAMDDEELSPAEKMAKVAIHKRVSEHALTHELAIEALGLGKKTGADKAPQTIVNAVIYAELSLEERIRRIACEVSGVPMILPAKIEVVKVEAAKSVETKPVE